MKKLLTSILTIALVFSVSTKVNAEGETPTPEPEETTITTVNETETKTLPEVLEDGEYGSNHYIKQSAKVVLDRNYDYNGDAIYVVNNAKVTIDLKGYTLKTSILCCTGEGSELKIIDSTASSKPVVSGYDVEYKSGKIDGPTVVKATNNGAIYLESGTIKGSLFVEGNESSTKEEDAIYSSITVNGGYIDGKASSIVCGNGAQLYINDGVLKVLNSPVISGYSDDNGETTVKIKDGKFIDQISDYMLNYGYIACGVYQPQNGTLEILGGEFYVERGVGILTRSGKTTISGNAKILVSGNYVGAVEDDSIEVPTVAVYNDLKAKYQEEHLVQKYQVVLIHMMYLNI